MLVQVDGLTESAGGVVSVEVRTSVGTVTARWCGDTKATPGEHHVEWTLDEEFHWGLNCFPATAEAPQVRQDERAVVFRGRLSLDDDRVEPGKPWANLALGEALIMLGSVEALPEGVAGSCVEVHVAQENVQVYRYLV